MSDHAYFGWLHTSIRDWHTTTKGLQHFSSTSTFWVFAGHGPNEVVDLIRDTTGAAPVYIDKVAGGAVLYGDLDELDTYEGQCDILMITRASLLVQQPERFLAGLARVVRPGGIALIDWLHGSSDRPAPNLPDGCQYETGYVPFHTTYLDTTFLSQFPRAFADFAKDLSCPTERLYDYVHAHLVDSGRVLLTEGDLTKHFTIVSRSAIYMRQQWENYYLYLLTILKKGS